MKKFLGLFLACAMILCAGCAGKKELKSIQLDPEANQVLVNSDTDIAIVTDPENVQLTDSDFTTLGATIEVNKDHAQFSATKPGTYTITAKKDGVTSNTIKITVVQEESDLAKIKVPDLPSQSNASTDSQTDMNVNVTDDVNISQSETANSNSYGTNSNITASNNSSSQSSSASDSTTDPNEDEDAQPYIPPKADQDALSAAAVLKDAADYDGQSITVTGTLNDKGTSLDGIKLIGYPVGIHSVPAQLTGTLEKQKDGTYALDVTSYAQIQ